MKKKGKMWCVIDKTGKIKKLRLGGVFVVGFGSKKTAKEFDLPKGSKIKKIEFNY